MKKLILVLSLVVSLSGCCLDQTAQEQRYINNLKWAKATKWKKTRKENVYILINSEGNYIYVTVDENNNVYDLEGNYLFNLGD